MSEATKVLAFAGSTRRDSYNKKLVGIAARGAEKAGAQVTLVDLADYPMPLFDEDSEKEKGKPEGARAFKELLLAHDAWLISSPEYNGSITAVLKNAIDWASRPDEGEKPLAAFTGKTVALMAASPGALGGLRGLVHVRAILSGLGMLVLPNQTAVSRAFEAFDDEGGLKDERKDGQIRGLGSELVRVASLLART